MSETSQILVGVEGDRVWVRVEGRGSFQNSPGLRDFARQMMARGRRTFAIDLSGCPVMDSTFMGTLAGIALRLRESGGGTLEVVRANERNYELLRNLGLDQLFTIRAAAGNGGAQAPAAPSLAEAPQDTGDRQAAARTMLEAHEALVEAAPENITKFKDVLDYLKQDLKEPL